MRRLKARRLGDNHIFVAPLSDEVSGGGKANSYDAMLCDELDLCLVYEYMASTAECCIIFSCIIPVISVFFFLLLFPLVVTTSSSNCT